MKFLLSILLFLASFCVNSAVITNKDAPKIKETVIHHIISITTEQFQDAMDCLTPELKKELASVNNFTKILKDKYTVVFTYASMAVQEPEIFNGNVYERVDFEAQDGSNWAGLFYMSVQPDGTWKISNFMLICNSLCKSEAV